ncbi:hypothetical protein N0V93_005548 [Gnomoniopsis smithogilvyi]|uniref:DUF4112 domain-containing protein n=1 Tax=Gnomoniopsis smithogilvyi TaxID=1191159 RepID=A0A9W8YUX8_9PEZI|nr:hypothetical protein N0V93_005548 [Gnomoniopsis smithogilvyi]
MSFLAKFAASKYVGDKLEENFGPENPKYDILITPDGRRKKTKKPLPPGLSKQDERVLKAIRAKAWRYEWWVDCHCCCGLHIQFGTVTLWGLLPVIGDVISLLNALTLIRTARKVDGGLPPFLVATMLVWAAVDFAIKLVPVVGDVLTAIIKPNTRNLVRVESFLARKGERRGVQVQVAGRGRDDGLVSEGGGRGVREPLLVGVQPQREEGMRAGGEGGVAEPAYGTVLVAGGAGENSRDLEGAGEGRQRSRHILPFWRRNEGSDSEDEV